MFICQSYLNKIGEDRSKDKNNHKKTEEENYIKTKKFRKKEIIKIRGSMKWKTDTQQRTLTNSKVGSLEKLIKFINTYPTMHKMIMLLTKFDLSQECKFHLTFKNELCNLTQ